MMMSKRYYHHIVGVFLVILFETVTAPDIYAQNKPFLLWEQKLTPDVLQLPHFIDISKQAHFNNHAKSIDYDEDGFFDSFISIGYKKYFVTFKKLELAFSLRIQ